MINVLPPAIKEARVYGRLNRLMVKLLIGIIAVTLLSTTVMLSGLRLTSNDEALLDNLNEQKAIIYADNLVYETEANKLRGNLLTISKILDREVKFSKLFVEIASSIPVGVQLTGLNLTGDNTEPLQITALAQRQELAATLQRNLIDSGVFEAADIQTVILAGGAESGARNYNVSILATLSGTAEKLRQEKAAAAAAAAAAAEQAAAESETTE